MYRVTRVRSQPRGLVAGGIACPQLLGIHSAVQIPMLMRLEPDFNKIDRRRRPPVDPLARVGMAVFYWRVGRRSGTGRTIVTVLEAVPHYSRVELRHVHELAHIVRTV